MLKWITIVLSLLVILFIILFRLPYYFEYGNPLPFISPSRVLYENLLLITLPLVFIGLIVGWKDKKTGGYLITVSFLCTGIIMSIISREFYIFYLGLSLLPSLVVGILYLIIGYKEDKKTTKQVKKNTLTLIKQKNVFKILFFVFILSILIMEEVGRRKNNNPQINKLREQCLSYGGEFLSFYDYSECEFRDGSDGEGLISCEKMMGKFNPCHSMCRNDITGALLGETQCPSMCVSVCSFK